MRITKIISFLFLLALTISCSSSDSGGSSANATSFLLNGSNVTLTSSSAQRSEDSFAISASASDGTSIQILFNKYGNLEQFSYYTANSDTYSNFQYYKSHYFTFNLISVNESSHKVKVSFSGTVYLDENDLTSASKTVSGTLDLSYVTQTPTIAGLGLNCKIAGSDWYETDFWDNGFGNVDRKYISDDDKMIIMDFTDNQVATGTYTFTTASSNKVQLSKYNTTTNTYTQYNAVGSLTVTSNTEPIVGIRIIQGTFSFTATNPANSSDVIQVTNGAFKSNF